MSLSLRPKLARLLLPMQEEWAQLAQQGEFVKWLLPAAALAPGSHV